jgi:hypothetical protein
MARTRFSPILTHMTTTEYLMNIGLIGLVVLQIRGHKITRARLLTPVVMTLWAASQFVHNIPTAGNDLVLETSLAVLGAGLGLAAGLATSVKRMGPIAFARAGAAAAALWIVGIGARLGFSIWVSHGGRGPVHHFSAANTITSGAAWGAAFVLMAMLEVAVRTGVMYAKALQTGAEVPRGGLRQWLVAA